MNPQSTGLNNFLLPDPKKKTGFIGRIGNSIKSKIAEMVSKPKSDEKVSDGESNPQPPKQEVYRSVQQVPVGTPFRMRRGKYVRQRDGSIRRIDKVLSRAKGRKLIAFTIKKSGVQAGEMARVWVNATRDNQRRVLRGRINQAPQTNQ